MKSNRCESLESRRYLSASLDPATRLLTVVGTSHSDYIRVATNGVSMNVTINGRIQSFRLSSIGSILIDALAGNDNVDINNRIKIPATLDGDEGKDSLGGGGGNDVIDGGSGADDIMGGPGIDLADYSGRSAGVSVSIGVGANDGEAGEHDTVHYDIEQIAGGSGNDTLSGSGAANTLIGNDGDDLLNGAGGDDSLIGATGDDTLAGGAGNDTFIGGDGSDWVDYSDHDAAAIAPGASLSINLDGAGDSGLLKNFQLTERDQINLDVENIVGSAGPDSIFAFGNGDNTIEARGGDDLVKSLDGNDSVDGGAGNDTLLGGNGNDQLVGGPDSLAADQSDQDVIFGEGGNDSLMGGADNDMLDGQAGNDTASGGAGDDQIFGEVDDDSLSGDAGNDSLSGGVGNDTLDGGDGVDSLSGDEDEDQLSDPGTVLPDLSEEDAADLQTPVDLDAIDTLDGGTGDDTVSGGAGQAFLFGSDGNDTLAGGAGSEVLDGGLGNDLIDGGDGDDSINGNFGADSLNGDAGNDLFTNADGEPDSIDGGDDLDLVQFEPAGIDTVSNTEGAYDAPDDATASEAQVAEQTAASPLVSSPLPYSITKGILNISGESDSNGNPLSDDISLSQSGATITLVENDNSYDISAVGLKGMLIDVGSGDDFVGLASSTGKSTINLPATMLGGKGDDVLRGGNGNDSMVGGLGNDLIAGNKGNDVLNGGSDVVGQDADGADTLMGGPGLSDSVRYDARRTPLSLSLDGLANDGAAGEGDLIGADVENIFGGRGNDSITGNAFANFLTGGPGADTIHGGAGNDKLIGACAGDSGDSIFGDAGVDLILIADKQVDHYNVGPGETDQSNFISKDTGAGGIRDVAF